MNNEYNSLKIFLFLIFTSTVTYYNIYEYAILRLVLQVERDPYNPDEQDPVKCGALESCLWELKVKYIM